MDYPNCYPGDRGHKVERGDLAPAIADEFNALPRCGEGSAGTPPVSRTCSRGGRVARSPLLALLFVLKLRRVDGAEFFPASAKETVRDARRAPARLFCCILLIECETLSQNSMREISYDKTQTLQRN